MVQDQLVEYISTQLKSGASAETVKTTLVGAGWQVADVDDTIKKVQSMTTAQPMSVGTGPATAATTAASSPKTVSTVTTSTTTKVEPQSIRVSDLVSATAPDTATSLKTTTTKVETTKNFFTAPVTATSYTAPTQSRGPLVTEIILGVLMIVFGALAAYFYFQNSSLETQISSLNTQSAGASSQVASLQGQLDASTTSLTAQLTAANNTNQELALNLAFYAVPLGASTTATSTTMLMGIVSGGGKASYVITTPYGVKVLVANSKDPKVVTLMQPLVGATTTMIQFAGTYVPGSDTITLTTINGVSLIAPPMDNGSSTASSTATSTMMMSSSTATSTQ